MPYRAGRYPHSAKGAMPLVPAGCLLMDHGRGCLGQALIIMTLALAVCFGGGRAEAATVACTAGINSNAGLNVVFNQGTGTCTTVSHASITQAVNGFVLGMNNSQWNVIIDKHNVFTGAIPSGHNYDCGANPATDCTVPVSLIDDNGNTITFTAVWTPGGGSMNLAAFNVSYTPLAPTITALSTNSGPTTGGQSVTLTGTYFDGTTSVTFGGTSASITSISSDGKTIAVTTPAHVSGPVDVAVTNGAGLGAQTVTSASAYTYVKANQSAVNVSASTNPFLLTSTTTLTGSGGNGSGAFSYSVAAAGTAGCSIAPGST